MEAIGQLAGGIAHDFRNQLTVIKGFGEMLHRRSLVKGKGQEMLGEILKAVERSTLLTNQLLTFSRKQPFSVQQVDLNELIVEIGKVIPRLVGEDVRLHITPGTTRCVAQIDPSQFQQAVINLATNARDAMPDGGDLWIDVSTASGEAFRNRHPQVCPGRYGVVKVSDTGCGMDEATLARMFEPFFTTKAVGEGTGLGLPMVYGFVKQSDGLIEVESQPGQGTTFRLCFPLVERVASSHDQGAVVDVPRGHGNILLVEDEPAVRQMLKDALQEAGYVVTAMANAVDALTLFSKAKSQIDLLVTDVVMPGGSGEIGRAHV